MVWKRAALARLPIVMAACAAIVWFAHLAVSYALVPTSCRIQSALPLLVATVIGVAIGAGCTVVAVRAGDAPDSWVDRLSVALRPSSSRGSESDTPSARVATAGLALAGYFTFVMLLAALIPILVDPCA